jgi:alanine racemase
LETLQALSKLNKKLKIHLFLNTGMNREWIDADLLPNALEFLKTCPKITVEWVMSHLFSANPLDIEKQVDAFKMMYAQILDYWHVPTYRHIWASTWVLKLQDDFFNAYRPWLALYGYNPLAEEDSDYELWQKLQPALSLTSIVTAINSVPYNEWVSYDPQWKQVEKEDKITITIPFGYAEWLPRAVREKIEIYHESGLLKQIWNVCMNLSCYMWNDKILIWDEVLLLDDDQNSSVSVSWWAKAAGTIPYEILVHLDKWIRREIVE